MRLLDRTIIKYLVYSAVVVLIGIPAFYFVINKLFIDDIDETLVLRKNDLRRKIEKVSSPKDVKILETFDRNIEVRPLSKMHADTLYYVTQFDSLENELEPYRALSSVVTLQGQQYELILRISLVENEDLIETIVTIQAVLLILLLAGMLIINWQISKQVWKPFYSTLEKLRQFELDKNPVLQLGKSTTKEFEDLNRAITQLAEHNYKTYLNQKEFTENASHEMQTPLAVFQTKLELLMQSKGLSEEQATLIQSLTDATNRLNRLNKSLLLLSKIDNNQFPEIEPVKISGLTNATLDQFRDQLNGRSIQVNFLFSEERVISGNKTLMEILFSNLIANAIRYNNDQGILEIKMENKAWTVSNTGDRLSIHREKIFERFQKGDHTSVGTGLGLAIVKKICDRSGFTIEYDFKNDRHIFSLTFP